MDTKDRRSRFCLRMEETRGRYNPSSGSWANVGTIPSPRIHHTAVWTGGERIVWGGKDQNSLPLNIGGICVSTIDSWIATTTINALDARASHTAVWTGSEMIVWIGYSFQGSDFNTGGRYNPATNSWTVTSTTDALKAETHTSRCGQVAK
jgi:hypothetical protein